jgi:hypothetical protein
MGTPRWRTGDRGMPQATNSLSLAISIGKAPDVAPATQQYTSPIRAKYLHANLPSQCARACRWTQPNSANSDTSLQLQ